MSNRPTILTVRDQPGTEYQGSYRFERHAFSVQRLPSPER